MSLAASRQLKLLGYTTAPALGPRVASVGSNGALQLIGWVGDRNRDRGAGQERRVGDLLESGARR